MDCLENIIGIIGCGAPTDEANELYINQLPGVTLRKIDSLADGEDQVTFLEVWADIKLRAMKKFEIQVKAAINKCYSITDKEVIECLVCANKSLFAVALWYLYGTELMIEITSTDTLNRWTTIDLDKAEQSKIDFYAEYQDALKDAVNSFNPQESDCFNDKCIECNDDVKFVQGIFV